MDKESADPDRVLNELTTKQIVPEEWGGDVPIAKVSAHTGQGIDELLDLILIQSELMELKASAEGAAQGVVIEARVDKGRGAVTSILVQNGTLNIGDLVLAGSSYGRVRAMSDENGKPIKSAGPSIPVEILGLPDAPMAGDEVLVVNDEKKHVKLPMLVLTVSVKNVLSVKVQCVLKISCRQWAKRCSYSERCFKN